MVFKLAAAAATQSADITYFINLSIVSFLKTNCTQKARNLLGRLYKKNCNFFGCLLIFFSYLPNIIILYLNSSLAFSSDACFMYFCMDLMSVFLRCFSFSILYSSLRVLRWLNIMASETSFLSRNSSIDHKKIPHTGDTESLNQC